MNAQNVLHNIRLTVVAMTFTALGWLASGCHQNDVWDNVPGTIAEFINHYFPYSELSSCTETADGGWHIRIDDGPGLTFSSKEAWVVIDGYGMPLPQVLLFDQLPPGLYNYVQETENLNGVFSMERDAKYYIITLLDSTVKYTIANGEMTMRE